MEEARKLRTLLFPLSRDIRNLRTFIVNIDNILQAEPQRFVVGAPVGLLSLRNSVRSLHRNTRAMKEATDITLHESSVAAALATCADTPLLRPAAALNTRTRQLKPMVDRAHASIVRIEGYLNPLFVFMAAVLPLVAGLRREVEALDERLGPFKKGALRLADLELTSGLPVTAEKELALLTSQFGVIEQEAADIAAQVGLLMGKLNRLSELSARLESLVRMGAALDGTLTDLVPSLAVLKNLGAALAQVQQWHDPAQSRLDAQLDEALAGLALPVDTLQQQESRLSQQVERYIAPIAAPLQALADQLRGWVPNTHELNGLESTLVAQSIRFGNVNKLVTRLFGQLERVIDDIKQSTHAA